MQTPLIPALLLRCTPAAMAGDAVRDCAEQVLEMAQGQIARIEWSRDLARQWLYGYAWLSTACQAPDALSRRLAALLDETWPTSRNEVFSMTPVQAIAGAQAGAAPFHYVVETDIDPAIEADLTAWYEQEHLPGLAAVPGTRMTRRFVFSNAEGGQRSLACYDLASTEVKQSEPWLAIRATAWSSRVRPHFKNYHNAMCRREVDLSWEGNVHA